MKYDSRGVKPSQFSDPVPDGEYVLQIIKTEEKTTSKGMPMVKVSCTIQSPPAYAGSAITHYVTLIPAGEPGAGIAIHFLKTIGQPYEETEDLDIEPVDWNYAKFKARIVQEIYTRPDGSKIPTNKIKSVMPIDDKEIAF